MLLIILGIFILYFSIQFACLYKSYHDLQDSIIIHENTTIQKSNKFERKYNCKSIKIILYMFGILVSNTTIMASTSQKTNIVVETFSDGSYIESSIFPLHLKALSSSSTKTASKTSTYKNNSGKTYGLLQ